MIGPMDSNAHPAGGWTSGQHLTAWLRRWAKPGGAGANYFASNPHLDAAWFELLCETAMPEGVRFGALLCGQTKVMLLLREGDDLRLAQSLSNFYSALYAPIGEGPCDQEMVCRAMGELRRSHWQVTELRLSPMDPQAADFQTLEAGIRQAGWAVDRYFCHGNWFHTVRAGGYAAYFAERPSQVRNTVTRSAKKLAKMAGYSLTIHQAPGEALEVAIDDFVQVYNHSWKRPEPFPNFVPELCRRAARAGWLRLGVIRVEDKPVAAQIWLVMSGVAHIFKLAYDERFTGASAGSVLTAALMQHAIDIDQVAEVDYLIGDDPYKQTWMTQRRERLGLVAFDLHRPSGLMRSLLHFGAQLRRRFASPAT